MPSAEEALLDRPSGNAVCKHPSIAHLRCVYRDSRAVAFRCTQLTVPVTAPRISYLPPLCATPEGHYRYGKRASRRTNMVLHSRGYCRNGAQVRAPSMVRH